VHERECNMDDVQVDLVLDKLGKVIKGPNLQHVLDRVEQLETKVDTMFVTLDTKMNAISDMLAKFIAEGNPSAIQNEPTSYEFNLLKEEPKELRIPIDSCVQKQSLGCDPLSSLKRKRRPAEDIHTLLSHPNSPKSNRIDESPKKLKPKRMSVDPLKRLSPNIKSGNSTSIPVLQGKGVRAKQAIQSRNNNRLGNHFVNEKVSREEKLALEGHDCRDCRPFIEAVCGKDEVRNAK